MYVLLTFSVAAADVMVISSCAPPADGPVGGANCRRDVRFSDATAGVRQAAAGRVPRDALLVAAGRAEAAGGKLHQDARRHR